MRKHKHHIARTKGDILFESLLYLFFGLFTLLCVFPFYYLFINTFAASPFATPEELYFVVEYGSVENAAQLRLYLAEHGAVVCAEDAVGTLGAIA